MHSSEHQNLNEDIKIKIEEYLIEIFKDVCFDKQNIRRIKDESVKISEEIKKFIIEYASSETSEADLFIKAKERGITLVESHNLVLFDETLEGNLKMRAFLIPNMKIEINETNEGESVTADDLNTLDHELCVSFKTDGNNEFIKIGNLIDIRAKFAKDFIKKQLNDRDISSIFKKSKKFNDSLKDAIASAELVLGKN